MTEPTATPTPAAAPLTREAVFTEMERAFTDPKHEMYRAAQRGLPMFDTWAEALYKRVPDGDKEQIVIAPGSAGVPVEATRDDDPAQLAQQQAFRASVDTRIVERGIDTAAVHAEGARLFGGAVGTEVLDLLDDRTLAPLAPEAKRDAHVAMASYLADLAALRSGGATADAEGIAPGDFQARYEAALRERGTNVQTLDQTIANLFMGRDDAYQHFVRHLDSFPPGARLATYVRSAEAVMMLSRLYQSQN